MTTAVLNSDTIKKHGFNQLEHFNEAYKETIPLNALELIRKASHRMREDFMATGTPIAVKQFLCSTSPYPTVYGFHASYKGLHPFLWFNNRATLVQFRKDGRVINFLFNPYFPDLSAQAPFYKNLKRDMPGFIPDSLFARIEAPILEQLAEVGVMAEDIHYVSYDHLHVQDMRDLMGTVDTDGKPARKAMFPNATFIFPKAEWDATKNLHPVVSQWYVKDGLHMVDTSKLLLYEGDIQLGDGCALIATPGHTPGNHSLYLNTSQGTMTISENAVGPDGYNPEASSINSVRQAAKDRNWEVILNANTLDMIFEQYNSVVKEKLLSGPSPIHPDFCNHRSSSEFTSWAMNPGLSPTIENGVIDHGSLSRQ